MTSVLRGSNPKHMKIDLSMETKYYQITQIQQTPPPVCYIFYLPRVKALYVITISNK